MANPNAWLAATAGSVAKAQQINQLLAIHANTPIYTGAIQSSVTTSGATTTASTSYLAQSFTTSVGQTTIGYVKAPISSNTALGANLPPTTLSVYTNNAGAPGTPIASMTLTAEYANFTTTNNTNVFGWYPLPVTGLTASTTYWLVVGLQSSGGFNYTWFRSASASGASTSANGTTWAAQAYGFRYSVFDATVIPPLVGTWEDNGARWTFTTYTASPPLISTYSEYTAGQTASGYLQSTRTYTYSNSNELKGVA